MTAATKERNDWTELSFMMFAFLLILCVMESTNHFYVL